MGNVSENKDGNNVNTLLAAVNDFKSMLNKRADSLFREAQLQSEMGNYDKAYAFKIKADEARLIETDLNGYLKQFNDC
jgi:hypothetical protein